MGVRVRLAAALVVAFVLAGLFGMAEAAVRVLARKKYGFADFQALTVTHPALADLKVLRPGLDAGPIRINALGFRGPELAEEKPPGALRLAFLGASTTFCAEVSGNDHVWPHLVTERLRQAHPKASIDYVNAAVPGYRLEQIEPTLAHRVAPLKPDVIVYYEGTNELSFDSRSLARERGLVPEDPAILRWMVDRSRLIELIEKNIRVKMRVAASTSHEAKLEVDPRLYSKHFEARLRAFVAFAKTQASTVVLVTFSPRIRRGLSEEELAAAVITSVYYMPYMTADGLIAGFEEYNRVVRSVAAELGVGLIEAEDAVPPDALHYTDSVHLTDRGAEALARRVSEGLLALPEISSRLGSQDRAAAPPGP